MKNLPWILPILVIVLLGMYGCENVRHSIGVTGKPLASDGKFEDSVKFNYKIVFGQIRSKKTEDDD
jgi:hypothetical protein